MRWTEFLAWCFVCVLVSAAYWAMSGMRHVPVALVAGLLAVQAVSRQRPIRRPIRLLIILGATAGLYATSWLAWRAGLIREIW